MLQKMKTALKKEKALKWQPYAAYALALALLAGALAIANRPDAAQAAAAKKELPIYCVQKEEKVASLSFDAAWGDG